SHARQQLTALHEVTSICQHVLDVAGHLRLQLRLLDGLDLHRVCQRDLDVADLGRGHLHQWWRPFLRLGRGGAARGEREEAQQGQSQSSVETHDRLDAIAKRNATAPTPGMNLFTRTRLQDADDARDGDRADRSIAEGWPCTALRRALL